MRLTNQRRLPRTLRTISAAGICAGVVYAGLGTGCASRGDGAQAIPDPVGIMFAASQEAMSQGIVNWRLFLGRSQIVMTGYGASGSPVSGLQIVSFPDKNGVPAHVRLMLLDGSGATARASNPSLEAMATETSCPSCTDAPEGSDLSVDPQNGNVSVRSGAGDSRFPSTSSASDSTASGYTPINAEQQHFYYTLWTDLVVALRTQPGFSQAGPLDLSRAQSSGVAVGVHPLELTAGNLGGCIGYSLLTAAFGVGTAAAGALTAGSCGLTIPLLGIAPPAAGATAWGCAAGIAGTAGAGVTTGKTAGDAWNSCGQLFQKAPCPRCDWENSQGAAITGALGAQSLGSQSGGPSMCSSNPNGGGDGGTSSEGGAGAGEGGGGEAGGGEAGYASMTEEHRAPERHDAVTLAPGASADIAFAWNDAVGVSPPVDLSVDARDRHLLQVYSMGKQPFARAGLAVVAIDAGNTYHLVFERTDDSVRVSLRSAAGEELLVARSNVESDDGAVDVADVVLPAAPRRAAVVAERL